MPVWLIRLMLTLGAVVAYARPRNQPAGVLRDPQGDLADGNGRDSMRLRRAQTTLTRLGLAVRDRLEGRQPYPRLRAAAFDERDVLRIILSATWFNPVNRVADALGVGSTPDAPA